MFLPVTSQDLKKFGIIQPDVILVSGDVYIDSPYDGIAVIGKALQAAGFTVAVISQPKVDSAEDIMKFGEPKLFWALSAGCVDSMVANYTASKKKRRADDLTPGGVNDRRPDRAVMKYTNMIQRFSEEKKPIVIGGIEASLRRIAHYDFWSNKVRRSVLLDSKADYLIYGEGEKTIKELAEKIRDNQDCTDVRGICYISNATNEEYIQLPSFEEVSNDKEKFAQAFELFYQNNDPRNAKGLCQDHEGRFLIQNPPQDYLNTKELDKIHAYGFKYDIHPSYKKQGCVKALDTIRFSLMSHRGCYGECNFCSIAVHQGRAIRNRSEKSIIEEAAKMTQHPEFKGYISDVGGATSNMFGNHCDIQDENGSCKKKRCAYPKLCENMIQSHKRQIELLRRIRILPGVKKVFIGSGVRHDLVLQDRQYGKAYLRTIVEKHVSGQMKIAPEHTEDKVLSAMGKPGTSSLLAFKKEFDMLNKKANLNQFLTYYFIAAHPGCSVLDSEKLKEFIKRELKLSPEQVQIFTPTPSTYSTMMYYTGINPMNGKEIFVETDPQQKIKQKEIVVGKPHIAGYKGKNYTSKQSDKNNKHSDNTNKYSDYSKKSNVRKKR